MITKKLWNNLTQETRTMICNLLGVDGSHSLPYYHDFDFDDRGRKLRDILAACKLQNDGQIKVGISLTPAYDPNAGKKQKPEFKKISVNEATAAILGGWKSACNFIAAIVKTFGNDNHLYVSPWTNVVWIWKVEEFCLNRRGEVLVGIRWHGSLESGNDFVSLSEISKNGTVVIPALTRFNGCVTTEIHPDIRITKPEIYEAMKAMLIEKIK